MTAVFVTHDVAEAVLLSDPVVLESLRYAREKKSFLPKLIRHPLGFHGRGMIDQSMTETYEKHNIQASAWRLADPKGWKPRILIGWSEDGLEMIKSFTIQRTFATEKEAQLDGLLFAKTWIDDGKPPCNDDEAFITASRFQDLKRSGR
jgi:ABC-type proline/glycine betaine transport system ATPase subunit